jgi:SAM-dependent methyltransferase
MPVKQQNSSILNIIDDKLISEVQELYSKVNKNGEFEFIFFNMPQKHLTYEKYVLLLKFMTQRVKHQKLEVVTENMLDISYRDVNQSYRLTISGIDDINYTIEPFHKYENHVTLKTLALRTKDKDNAVITLMKKVKDSDKVVDLEDVNLRIRLSEEVKLTESEFDSLQKLNHRASKDITFRLKQRVSFYILGNSDSNTYIKIDMTITKMANHINRVNSAISNYEVEIELMSKDGKAPKDKTLLDTMFKESDMILKIVQQSNYIISESKEEEILKEYARIIGANYDSITGLDSRQPISLEIQHVTEMLPNRYAVTDKADGDRYFLIVVKNHVYLISTGLHVKDTGIELDEKLSKFNDSILDGEHIFLPSRNRHIYMTFDCLFKGGQDIRKTQDFMVRLSHADDLISHCFVTKGQKGYVYKQFDSKSKEFKLQDVINFHTEHLTEFTNNLNHDIDIDKKVPLIRRKYFIPVLGAFPWEIFAYSSLLYKKHTEDKNIKTPYLLDGLVYHPLSQDYNTNSKESKLSEYKWKPPEKNSIDFYVTFERDKDSGKIVTAYDNSVDDYIRNKPYKICNLHVGKKGKNGEEPTLFREMENGFSAHLFVKDGEAVDVEGNLLSDKTVVEFYYDNNPELDEKFRWVPLRTRYDKTESVQKYKRKYGNYIDIAMKVWRSIVNPLLITDFDDLARGNDEKTGIYYYDKKLDSLRGKISHELILTATKENQYFQLRTNLAKPMRQFHNWVKSILIYTHCHPTYQNDRKLSILDIACGRGGDLMKFYYCNIAYYVGIDIDKNALTSAIDGAVSRYNQFKKQHDAFPKMYFIQADARALINYSEQYRVLGGMSKENKESMEKFFPNDSKKVQFDRVNCQYAIHYFMDSQDSWNNFKENLRNTVKPGGYFLVSTFDGHLVNKLIGPNDKYTVYYTTNKGEKKILFEFVKKYGKIEQGQSIGLGNAIDVYLAWIFQEGNYMTEYLVDRNFIEAELAKDCDFELVDTELYGNLMEYHRDFFLNYAQYEETAETNKFFKNTKEYYVEDDVNKGCYLNTQLLRYYIFRRKDIESIQKNTPKQKEQKGGNIDLLDKSKFIVHSIKNSSTSYCDSLHHILRTHKLIPSTYRLEDLFKDFKLTIKHDVDIDNKYLNNISNNISIFNSIKTENGVKNKHVLDGLNVVVVEKDCNNHYDVELIKKTSSGKRDKAIIIFKDNNEYRPVYRIEDETKRRGIYTMDDSLVKQLLGL